MTKPPIIVTEETRVQQAKDIMRVKMISGMPVINRNLSLRGIISIEDIIKVFEKGKLNDPVGKWMTKNTFYLNKDDTIMKFLELNEKRKFGRYPVVNNDMRVVGVVTKLDILEWLFKKLGYIYVHDKIRFDTLNKNYISSITEENTDTNTLDYKLKINYNNVEMIGLGATKLKKFLTDKNIDKDLVRRISIAAYEAEANVVIHSESEGNIFCWIKDDHIKLVIEDFGKGIEDLELAFKEGFSTAQEHVREKGFGAGMGIPNMKRFSDRMTLISSSNKGVKLEMLFFFKNKED
jgi:anti-sigma regulatory factor (Ser/Thr protein kinase)/predicted transcriptional regulator